MKKIIVLISLSALFSCSSTGSGTQTATTDATYGYSVKNPIKVGGVSEGPGNERNFLNSLSGPNGEAVSYYRTGSCCGFDTKNSPFGMGMLDIYKVTYENKKDTVSLYINMYDKAKLKAPMGFKFK